MSRCILLVLFLAGPILGQFLQQIRPVNQPRSGGFDALGGLGVFQPGLGGQRAEGVVQAQPDVKISSLSPEAVLKRERQMPIGNPQLFQEFQGPQLNPYGNPIQQPSVNPNFMKNPYQGANSQQINQNNNNNGYTGGSSAYGGPSNGYNNIGQGNGYPQRPSPYRPTNFNNNGGLIPATENGQIPIEPFNPEEPQRTNFFPSMVHPPLVGQSNDALPSFLEGANSTTIGEFKRILRQPQVAYPQKLKQVEQLVSGLDGNRQKLFRDFVQESNQLQQGQQRQGSVVQQRSQPKREKMEPNRLITRQRQMGQAASPTDFEDITRILQDESIPEDERWNRVVTLYKRLTPAADNQNDYYYPQSFNL